MVWFLWAMILGLIVGAIAKLILPGKDPGGILVTILLGVMGAILAQFVVQLFEWYPRYKTVGFIPSVIGAFFILGIYRLSKTKGKGDQNQI
jgi:uncharacterized membrane protein YeaQ/YmgE (transglycosylase-associated protein family)